jgi:hypothetical protein
MVNGGIDSILTQPTSNFCIGEMPDNEGSADILTVLAEGSCNS